jgi:p-aminobenzoyl-glutamate transporter AbgT
VLSGMVPLLFVAFVLAGITYDVTVRSLTSSDHAVSIMGMRLILLRAPRAEAGI